MSTCSLIKFYTNDVSFRERWGPFAVPRRPLLRVCVVVVNCVRTCAHSHLPVSFGCVRTCRCARGHLFPHLISNEQLLIASPSCGGARRQRLRLSQPVNNYSAWLVESLMAKDSRKIHCNETHMRAWPLLLYCLDLYSPLQPVSMKTTSVFCSE